ncbi:hypothetical protein [uncultured Hoeflea sp.]|uniref:hypothetical protein n=1 Tax=uncultured Hoeflea sp. TaxID=538666 RepID=UPI00261A949B|nr:hypothetical protein [uncultured Hoeflea sp.]
MKPISILFVCVFPMTVVLSGCAKGPKSELSDRALEANSAGQELAIAGLRRNCYPEQSLSITELEARVAVTSHGYSGGRISQLPTVDSVHGSPGEGGGGSSC